MTLGFDDRTEWWAWIERLAKHLAADPDLADAFERTPGKVAQQLGIPPEAIGSVLAKLSRSVLAASSLEADPLDSTHVEPGQTAEGQPSQVIAPAVPGPDPPR